MICVKARCVPLCGTGEFRCDVGKQCVEGACIDVACVDVACEAGKVCMDGKCIGACDEVVCPHGQACADGLICGSDGICRELGRIGDGCNADDQCASEHCDGGACARPATCALAPRQ